MAAVWSLFIVSIAFHFDRVTSAKHVVTPALRPYSTRVCCTNVTGVVRTGNEY